MKNKWLYTLDTERFLQDKRRRIDELVEDDNRLIFSYRGNKDEGFVLPKSAKIIAKVTGVKNLGEYISKSEFNAIVPAYHRKYYTIEEIAND